MLGRQSIGIKTPLIRDGDNLLEIIPKAIFSTIDIENGDIIGITESIVARSQGNYATIDEIATEIRKLNFKDKPICLWNPIYSRNRFAMILKAIARSTTNRIYIIMPPFDEVGNPKRYHPFTGLNYDDYYREICEAEHCTVNIIEDPRYNNINDYFNINCMLRPKSKTTDNFITLKDICSDKTEYGLLGSNKSTEEKLKLFPNIPKAQKLVNDLQNLFKEHGYNVEVMIYADGCFKDPFIGIWEFADPVTSPVYTNGLGGVPNELKLKAFVDEGYTDEQIKEKIQSKQNLFNNMSSQGTTPRRKIDLLASLMDLTSGSGDAGTPIVVVKNYNTTY